VPRPVVDELSGAALDRAVRRNTLLLSAAMAVTSATLQLVAALATVTFVLVTGIEGLLGLGPAIFLSTAAMAALPAGRAMDRFGRIPVLAAGYVVGVIGAVATGLGTAASSSAAVIAGFVLIGAANGTVLLSRAAGGDMYPPERRARGISLVLFGAVFGAILGPAVFSPLVAGKDLDGDALMLPWLASGGLMLVGLVLVLFVRPDPKAISDLLSRGQLSGVVTSAAPLREIVRRPGVVPALLAALASFGVMVGVMNLTGYAVVHEHGHHQETVFPIIGAHVLGMYALVLVVGTLIDRIGVTPSLVGGLTLMGASCALLNWGESVLATAILLFGLGLGWNLSFVAATKALVDCTAPIERGKLLGLNDLASAMFGAVLALVGGYALEAFGVIALALGAAVIVVAPVLYVARPGGWRPPTVSVSGERP